jgi:hypothetical protein
LAPRLAMPDWEPPLAPAVVSCSGQLAGRRRELGRAGPCSGATTSHTCNVCMRRGINSRARQRPPSPAMCRRRRGRPRLQTVHRDCPRRCHRRAEEGRPGRACTGPAPAGADHPQIPCVTPNTDTSWLPARAVFGILPLKSDQNNSSCGSMACWALGPFGHGRKYPASIAAQLRE